MVIETHRPARDRGNDLRSVVTARDAGMVVLALSGELAGGPGMDRLGGTIRRLRTDPEVREVVLDLEHVPYLSSLGLARLLLLREDLRGAGTRLRVTNASGQVREKLRLTGVLAALGGDPGTSPPASR